MPKLPRTMNLPVPASPTRREILEGLRITAPVAAGYIPLGLAYGVLVIQLGLPWWLAPALSLTAYSGSAELLVVTLAAQNTPLAVIAVTMLLVNFRLLFFAFSFPLHVIEGRFARLFSMYALVDEAYALTAARPNGWTKPRLLAMQVLFNLTWLISSLVGVSAGSLIPTQIEENLHRQQSRLRPPVRSGGGQRVGFVHEGVHREEARDTALNDVQRERKSEKQEAEVHQQHRHRDDGQRRILRCQGDDE